MARPMLYRRLDVSLRRPYSVDIAPLISSPKICFFFGSETFSHRNRCPNELTKRRRNLCPFLSEEKSIIPRKNTRHSNYGKMVFFRFFFSCVRLIFSSDSYQNGIPSKNANPLHDSLSCGNTLSALRCLEWTTENRIQTKSLAHSQVRWYCGMVYPRQNRNCVVMGFWLRTFYADKIRLVNVRVCMCVFVAISLTLCGSV